MASKGAGERRAGRAAGVGGRSGRNACGRWAALGTPNDLRARLEGEGRPNERIRPGDGQPSMGGMGLGPPSSHAATTPALRAVHAQLLPGRRGVWSGCSERKHGARTEPAAFQAVCQQQQAGATWASIGMPSGAGGRRQGPPPPPRLAGPAAGPSCALHWTHMPPASQCACPGAAARPPDPARPPPDRLPPRAARAPVCAPLPQTLKSFEGFKAAAPFKAAPAAKAVQVRRRVGSTGVPG